MHIITRARLIEFANKYPDTKTALDTWYRKVKRTDYDSFSELRLMFPSADKIGKCTVFNIGGHKVRLIAVNHYNRHKIYIRYVLTHAEYDLDKWMNLLLENTINYWPHVAQVLSVPQTKADYQRTVTLLDELVNIVGDDESHSLTIKKCLNQNWQNFQIDKIVVNY
jgi:mRNA interferase HigB